MATICGMTRTALCRSQLVCSGLGSVAGAKAGVECRILSSSRSFDSLETLGAVEICSVFAGAGPLVAIALAFSIFTWSGTLVRSLSNGETDIPMKFQRIPKNSI